MSRSASGTLEDPGRNVKSKSGLNKAILDQGWANLVARWERKHMSKAECLILLLLLELLNIKIIRKEPMYLNY